MSQWKSYSNTTGMPKWSASINQQGSGATAKTANNVSLSANLTAGAFVAHGVGLNKAIGIFPVTPGAKANTTGESAKVKGLGWAQRTAGEGPINTLNAANGATFGNGETVLISGGSVNAVASLTTNVTGNLASATVVGPGGYYPNNGIIPGIGLFPNTSPNNVTVTFSRELHVANLNFSNSTTLVGAGNANTINFVIAANSVDTIGYGVSARGSFLSNASGGFTNSTTQAITWTGNSGAACNYWGLFSNVTTNTSVIVTFTNANGTVITGTYAATANLVPSTGGAVSIATLGGRAGRVRYEILAVDRHIVNTATGNANTVVLPQ